MSDTQPTNAAGTAAFLGLGIPFFSYWVCCGVIFWYVQRYLQAGEDESGVALRVEETTDVVPPGRIKNYWAYIGIATDFLQLSAFPLNPDVVPWPDAISPFFQGIFSFFMLNLHSVGDAEYAVFWLVFFFTVAYATILVLLLVGAMCDVRWINQIKDNAIDLKDGWLKTTGEFIMFELPPILYLPVGWSMMQWLSCSYDVTPPTLDMDPRIPCWEGVHILYAIFSLLALFLFFPITLLVSAGRIALATDVRLRPSFLILVAMLKFLVVSIAQFFTGYRLLFSLGILFLNAALLAANMRMKPCSVRSVNMWRTTALTASTWTASCALLSLLTNPTLLLSSGPTIKTNVAGPIAALVLLMVGWAAIFGFGGWRHRKRVTAKRWGSVEDTEGLSEPMVVGSQPDMETHPQATGEAAPWTPPPPRRTRPPARAPGKLRSAAQGAMRSDSRMVTDYD